jgi:hypothetical protein
VLHSKEQHTYDNAILFILSMLLPTVHDLCEVKHFFKKNLFFSVFLSQYVQIERPTMASAIELPWSYGAGC